MRTYSFSSTTATAVIAVGFSIALWWHFRSNFPSPSSKGDDDDDDDDSSSSSSSTVAVAADTPAHSTENATATSATTTRTAQQAVQVKAISIGTDKSIFGATASSGYEGEVRAQKKEESKTKEEVKHAATKQDEEELLALKNGKFRLQDIPDFTIELDEEDADMF